MKKLFYILIISTVASMAVMSCTEEEVTPSLENSSGGGGVFNDKLR